MHNYSKLLKWHTCPSFILQISLTGSRCDPPAILCSNWAGSWDGPSVLSTHDFCKSNALFSWMWWSRRCRYLWYLIPEIRVIYFSVVLGCKNAFLDMILHTAAWPHSQLPKCSTSMSTLTSPLKSFKLVKNQTFILRQQKSSQTHTLQHILACQQNWFKTLKIRRD